jgi:ATP-dependent Zn protease
MVTEFGFSKRIGPFSYAGLPERERRLTDYPEVIAEARETVKELERECDALLNANRIALEGLSAALLDAETVSGDVVEACLAAGGAPSDPNDRNTHSLPLAA